MGFGEVTDRKSESQQIGEIEKATSAQVNSHFAKMRIQHEGSRADRLRVGIRMNRRGCKEVGSRKGCRKFTRGQKPRFGERQRPLFRGGWGVRSSAVGGHVQPRNWILASGG